MVRIGCLVIIGLVTSFAGIRRVVVIAVVASCTIIGNIDVCSGERVNIAMVESRWRPAVFIVANRAIRRELQGNVVRVGRLIVIVFVAAVAGIRRVVVISVVAGCTVVGNVGMCSHQSKEIVVHGEARRVPVGLSGMAGCAIRGQTQSRMVGVGRLIVIVFVAAVASVRRAVVISVVATRTVIGNISVGAVEHEIVVVISKTCRAPPRLCSVATLAIRGQIKRLVVGVGSLVEIRLMAALTIGGCALVASCVAIDAIQSGVGTRQWECRAVVVENQIRIPRGVAGQTGRAVVAVPIHTVVLIIRFRVGVAIGTGEHGIIRRRRMAIDALAPFSLVFATVNREILPVVVKSGRYPRIFIVASCTIHRKLQSSVIGVGGVVIIVGVAPVAGVRRAVVIAVVTCCAIVGDGGMRTI